MVPFIHAALLWKSCCGLRGSSKAGQEELIFRHVLWAIPSAAARGETFGCGLEVKSATGESCRGEGDRKRYNKHKTINQMHDGLGTPLFQTNTIWKTSVQSDGGVWELGGLKHKW